jgi:hypothetical protein
LTISNLKSIGLLFNDERRSHLLYRKVFKEMMNIEV